MSPSPTVGTLSWAVPRRSPCYVRGVDETRRQRYLDKLVLVQLRRRQVEEWTSDLTGDLAADARTQLAVYKALQEIVESAMDLCAMRMRDIAQVAKDDYSNIDLLAQRGEISADLARVLREANGLRNRLVHTYDRIRDDLVLVFVRTRLPELVRLAEEVRPWTAT